MVRVMDVYFMKTQRLGFRKWQREDLSLAMQLWSNHSVTKYISATGIYTDEMIRERFKLEMTLQQEYGYCYWPLFLLEDDTFIGVCGLRPVKVAGYDNVLEIGVHLIDTYWHQGYAFEAMQRVVVYALQELKVDNLFAGHNPHNLRSKALLKALGFTYFKDEFYEPTGLMHPSYLYYHA